MALDTQDRPKRSPERAPTDGERLIEAEEAARTGNRPDNNRDEPDDEPGYEDDPRQSERRQPNDNLDEVGRQALDVEKRARKLGWRPLAEWTKAPELWMDAEAWIDKVLANRPLAEDRFNRIEKQNDVLAAQVAESNRRLAETGQVIKDLYDQQKTVRKREYDRAREDIMAEQRQAVADGDVAAYDAAKAREQALDKDNEEPVKRQEAQRADAAASAAPDPVVTRWRAANPWFDADPVMNKAADSYHVYLRTAEPTLSLGENLAKVREEMLRRYPDKFPGESAEGDDDDPPARQASAVRRPTGNAGRRERGLTGRTVKDLPAADYAAFQRQMRSIPGFTEKEFLANYIWEDQDQRR